MIYNIYIRILNVLIVLYYRNTIKLGTNVFFRKFPSIIKHKKAKIEIGSETIINSSNYGYHINMFQKCKLFADRPGAQIIIGKRNRIHGTCIHAYNSIIIGDNCLIAANTQIVDGNGHLLSFNNPENRINTKDDGRPIIIGNNVWISANCIILGGTIIGEGSVIAVGSIVKGEVPVRCIYGGNPAKLIKKY